ncbi:hypothetical protein [Acinetobacter soli]|uniref:hypothetical protein n=1 Tax=Acinetobacter soli TaxID=487316 RepID=UPI00125F53C8|nr:hypothetical protein [Acinetobacter soli]WOQ36985.1 hypothetical protein R3L12_15935 [Acinetobacter soli]
MNAKVNIQFPEKSFYSAINILDAYSLALDSTTQLKVLISRINKETQQLIEVEQKSNSTPHSFTDVKSLISVAEYLAESYTNIFDSEYEKYKNASKNINVKFDAADLSEAYGLAHEISSWFGTLLYQIKDELLTIKENSKVLCDAVFASLKRLIDIADFLSESLSNTFQREFEKYDSEWEASKNG